MSENSSRKKNVKKANWRKALAIIAWASISFMLAQGIVFVIFLTLNTLNVPLVIFGAVVLQTIAAAAIYTLTMVIAIGAPWVLKKHPTTAKELGLDSIVTWKDILLAPAAFVVYFIASAIAITIVGQIFGGFDPSQAQDVGFTNISGGTEVFLAFLTLVVIAPFAEEVVFRGYLYGRLRTYVSAIFAALVSSLLFGLLHGQVNVAIDTFILGLMLCVLREVTGSIWAGILLHMLKNGIAFYLLFINPTLMSTIGG